MRARLLTIAVALASVFGAQQAIAKSSTKPTTNKQHHHKKHMKKTAALTTAPTAKAA